MGNSVQLIMKTFSTYEVVSDQLVNRDKSHFMIPSNAPAEIVEINEVTYFTQKEITITYLCCPLYIGRHSLISGNFASHVEFYSASLSVIHTPLPLRDILMK